MSRYLIAIPYTAYANDYTWVDADSEEEALNKVKDMGPDEFTNPSIDFSDCEWDYDATYVVEVQK